MPKRYLSKDYAAYIALKAAGNLASIIPLSVLFWIGRVAGFFMYHLHPRRKRIAYANLKSTFSMGKTPTELKRILKSVYANYGQTMVEMIAITRIDKDYLNKYVKIEGIENFYEASSRNKGVIFLTSHFGNWEIAGLKSASIGFPMYILVSPFKLKMLGKLFYGYRAKFGNKIINRGMPFREMIRALRDGNTVGIAGDQDVGSRGVFIDLLGRPASHAVGAARLARDTGAAIVPVFISREDGPNHLVKVEKPIEVMKTDDRDADMRQALEVHAKVLESYVRQEPDQWMWVYTRWKSTPSRKILILSDGKQGHLNQSLAALDVIKRCRRDSGFTDNDIRSEIIDIRFKNRLSRLLLSSCALFSAHACQGCMRCLKLSLAPDSYDKVMRTYADIVISCGSSLSAVNILISKENNAKNVVIMKPGVVNVNKFNVAIIPEHDRPVKNDRVVITNGSPNLISEAVMKDGAERIRRQAVLTDRKNIGLLLGGNAPGYDFSTGLLERIMDQVERSLEKLNMELLVTTSRRTPSDVEELLKRRLANHSRCRLLVIANENNIKNAVGGILDLSDIVLVSGESISMVSEAASSGKRTVVFDLDAKRPSLKHKYAMKSLASKGFITHVPVDRLGEAIVDVQRSERQYKRLDNDDRMYEKLYRII